MAAWPKQAVAVFFAGISVGWLMHTAASSDRSAQTHGASANISADRLDHRWDEQAVQRLVRQAVRDELSSALSTLRGNDQVQTLPSPSETKVQEDAEEYADDRMSAVAEMRARVSSAARRGHWGPDDAMYLRSAATRIDPDAFEEIAKELVREINGNKIQLNGALF